MRRIVKKYIIPHEGNNHTPHLLREAGVIGLVVVIVGLFSLSAAQVMLLRTTNLAAVLSPVLVDLTNADRQAQNLTTLTISPLLTKAAQLKADDMAIKGYFSHVSPDGNSPWYWFDLVGYKFMYAGENLAVNFSESRDVEQAWMNSPGHRSNILNNKFTEIGIATQHGTYQGQSAIFVTQMFGKPLPQPKQAKAKVPATVVPRPTSTLVTNQTGTVKAASTSSEEVIEDAGPELRTLVSEEMFVAVERVATDTPALIEPVSPVAGTTETIQYSNALKKVLSQPRTALAYAYGFVAALVLLVMGLIILGEYRKHHARNVSYGAGILVVMAILFYSLNAIIPQVIIV
ncbi:MAG: hypothetical protein K0S38_40 [Candidatus Paceibacter sp.]|jgi:hypothetical protein|nr:hypothetical protein [Candidatus Paceibacter sp.]